MNFDTACVIKSSLADNEALFPPAEIGVTMKNKYENNKNILWQHYSTTKGTSIIYPATNWTRCSDFDPRWRYSNTNPQKAVKIFQNFLSSVRKFNLLPSNVLRVHVKSRGTFCIEGSPIGFYFTFYVASKEVARQKMSRLDLIAIHSMTYFDSCNSG